MAHLKRLVAPKTWKIHRKEQKFIKKPNPGGHKLENCLALGVVLRDMLEYAKNMSESKKILNARKITVNGKVRTDVKYPLGLMDLLQIKDTKEDFLVILGEKGRITLKKVEKTEGRTCRIENKTKIKGGKIQLNLWGGANILVDKDDYKTGDSVELGIDGRIKGKLERKAGAKCTVIGGKHIGKTFEIKSIDKKTEDAVLKGVKGEARTRLSNIYVIK